MSNIATLNNSYNIAPHIWNALKTVVYDGAKDESIKLVLDYCKANALDPMQKPVHIVPMGSYNAQNKWVQKDTIWVGIGLYRIQAERSGNYAGVSEPEYGNTIEGTFIKINKDHKEQIKREEIKISYPEWCKISVRKIVQGNIVEFTAKEYWLENYSKLNKSSTAPNAMWMTRPFGQLAKCTEAQALRKAFPELIPQQPTAEEMDGKILHEFNECSTNNEPKNITPKVQTLSARLDDLIANSEDDDAQSVSKATVEEKVPSLTVTKEFMNLCAEHNLDAKEFAKFHNIDSKHSETVTNGIANFNLLKEQFLNAEITITH